MAGASPDVAVDIVVKLGGATLADPQLLDDVSGAICTALPHHRLLVVPGGGLFADSVRELDRRHGLSDDAAHWMAVLAMDQSAHLVAERLADGIVVSSVDEVGATIAAGRVPVLAPSRWMQLEDPLPHTWDVTSDSIAAWVAGRLGAQLLVLVKPAGVGVHASDRLRPTGSGEPRGAIDADRLVDRYFPLHLPQTLRWTIVPADKADLLTAAIAAVSG